MKTLIFLTLFITKLLAVSVTDGSIELDGNAISNGGTDWENILSEPLFSGVIADPAPMTTFTGGGSKDRNDISSWRHEDSSVPDKNDITNSYAFAEVIDNELLVYFGSDRFSNDGDSAVGFWFFQDSVQTLENGQFSGLHQNGDILVVANYGSEQEIIVYEWQNRRLVVSQAAGNAVCQSGTDQIVCAVTNSQIETSPWSYTSKSGLSDQFPPESFLEGGINLNRVFDGRDVPCFRSFLAVTRSSSSLNAQLKDFVLGSFDLCSISISHVCDSAILNNDHESITFGYQIIVENTGIGTLHNIDVRYNNSTVAMFITLMSGEIQTVSDTFQSTDRMVTSDGANVVASKVTGNPGPNDLLIEFADADMCPVLDFTPAISVDKMCSTDLVNLDNKLVVRVSYSGSVCNTGDLRVNDVMVQDDNESDDDMNFSLIDLLPGECDSYSGSYFPQSGDEYTDTVTATAEPTLDYSALSEQTSATCPLCPQ